MGKQEKVKLFLLSNNLISANTENISVNPVNNLESNQKDVNQVYINAVETRLFDYDSTEYALLYSVASQSPLEGGRAVYDARTLLRINFDDSASGNTNQRIFNEELKISNAIFNLYPNPNNGEMIFDYALAYEADAKFVIYDVTGRKINSYQLSASLNSITISEAALKNGVYFYKIISNDAIIFTDKFVIIK